MKALRNAEKVEKKAAKAMNGALEVAKKNKKLKVATIVDDEDDDEQPDEIIK